MNAGAVPSLGRPVAGGRVRHGLAVALAHEAPPAALMLGACAAGSPAALCGAAVALALLSIAYARAARVSAFAREHVVDLWAMLLVMVGVAFAAAPGGAASAPPAAGHHHLATATATAPATSAVALALVVVAVGGWVAARAVLARRTLRAHTVVSAAVCGGMLAAMVVM